MTKNLGIISISLEDGKHFELTALDFSDNPSILERAKTTFNYILSNLSEETVADAKLSIAMDIALLTGLTLLLLSTIIPRVIAVL